MNKPSPRDYLIIGAGASGLFCSLFLGKEKKILILDHNENAGKKLLLSGGGRCNFSNAKINIHQDYLTDDYEYLAKTIKDFDHKKMQQWLEKKGIASQEEDRGRLLLKGKKSAQIVQSLLDSCKEQGITIQYANLVQAIDSKKGIFEVKTSQGIIETKQLIIASGGKSFPAIGGTDFGLYFAKTKGINYHPPAPALCGIETEESLEALSGGSLNCHLELWKEKKLIYQESGPLLFTHRGISGPIVFNTSLWIAYHFLGNTKGLEIRLKIPKEQISKRLLTFLKLKHKKTIQLKLHPKELRSRDQAKIMSGGILLSELTQHFELKKIPGIFVIGEILNVSGKTGGYNLQRCWSSAIACAKGISEKN